MTASASIPPMISIPQRFDGHTDAEFPHKETSGFADILRGLELPARSIDPGGKKAAGMRQLSQIAAPGVSYNSAPVIGEDAISFAARPLLAPVSIDVMRFDVVPMDAIGIPNGVYPTAQKLDLHPSTGERHLTEAMPDPFRTSVMIMATSVPKNDRVIERATPLPMPSLTRAILRESPPAQMRAPSNEAARSAPKTFSAQQGSPTFQANSQLLAQLSAHPGEYRIVVRGQQLNEGERQWLITDMRKALMGLGLPLNPISILQSGKDA